MVLKTLQAHGPRRVALLGVLGFTLLSGACAPSLTIVSWEPGKIATRGARTLVLVDAEGRSTARHIAAQLMVREAKGGWFRVEDRGADGIKLQLVGERAEIAGPNALPEDALWARVDVVEWDTEDTTIDDEDKDGNAIKVPAQRSEVSLQITISDREGKVLMREHEYVGTVLVEAPVTQLSDPLLEAARAASSSFLADITPRQTSQTVRLDDTDGGLKSALKNITENKWTLAEAERKLRRYLKRNTNNAIATYNLAVLVDAQGRHEDALSIYDEAMTLHARDYYIEARAGCARRATAKKSVFGVPTAASAGPVEDIPADKAHDDEKGEDATPAGAAPPPPA